MANFDEVGRQFVQHYYQTFDSNRQNLASLYSDQSMLTYEGEQYMGGQQIMEKYSVLPGLQHKITTLDFQPIPSDSSILVMVCGVLSVDGAGPMKFSQSFRLCVGGQFGYYCHNDIFRLNLG